MTTSSSTISVADPVRASLKTGPWASFCVVLALLLLAACGGSPEVHVYSGDTMGTSYHVKVIGQAPADLADRIQSTLAAVDAAMTTYDPASELNRLNAAPVGEAVELSPELADVLAEARAVFRLTDGAFDPTVGPLVDLWGFGPRDRDDRVPSEGEIGRLLANVGYGRLGLDGNRATRRADIRLDLSAIAKGYGVDRVAELLEAAGIANYMVEVGGEVRVAGTNADGGPWRIAIEAPSALSRSVQRVIAVSDTAIATSGDYRNYFEQDGQRYSHTLDPRTGYPVAHDLVSVTVLADNAARADALATAFAVLGADAALALAEAEDIAVFLLVKEGEGFRELYSSRFQPLMQESLEETNN